jgi:lipoate-protein ligase A
MEGGRLLFATKDNPYENLALEEAILSCCKRFTLRLWENQESVVIGRGQIAALETDLDACIKNKIPIVRRITGGGAVYNGPGNLNWSFFIPSGYIADEIYFTTSPRELIRKVGTFMARCFSALGCFSTFKERGIYSESGKISGISAYISRDRALCHGTLLVDANLQLVEKLTTPKPTLSDKKYVRSNFVTVSNSGIKKKELISLLADLLSLEDYTDAEDYNERELCKMLTRDKYIKESWNLGDPFEFE